MGALLDPYPLYSYINIFKHIQTASNTSYLQDDLFKKINKFALIIFKLSIILTNEQKVCRYFMKQFRFDAKYVKI